MQNIKCFLLFLFFPLIVFTQQKPTELFQSEEILPIQISFSSEEVKRSISDTLYFDTVMKFQTGDKVWNDIDVGVRARGNFRRGTCYFPPIKMKIKKKHAKGTLFEGNKRLKLVLPCIIEKDKNDNVLKELIAYKLFEIISPYHFKTRQVAITFSNIDGDKVEEFFLKGFFIEDDKNVAKRFEGKVTDKYTHPMAMGSESTIKNSFFQFMIGNTDFAMGYQHNGKLMSIEGEVIPIPYDFDLSGLVNPSYVKENSAMGDIRERSYLGYKREESVISSIRNEFIEKKPKFFKVASSFATEFDDASKCEDIVKYLNSFFEIIENDRKFKNEIVDKMKTK